MTVRILTPEQAISERRRTDSKGKAKRPDGRRRPRYALMSPRMIERQAAKLCVKIIEKIRAEVTADFVRALPMWYSTMAPVNRDGAVDILAAVNAANTDVERIVKQAEPAIDALAADIDDWTDEQLKQYQEDIPSLKKVLSSDTGEGRIDLWKASLALMIVNSMTDTVNRIGGIVLHGIAENKSIADVERSIRSRRTQAGVQTVWNRITYKVSNDAENAVANLAGGLYGDKQQAAGIAGYIWRAVMDTRTRPAHAARNGLRFTWNNPPPDGHPSQAYNCRCWAEPDPETVGESPERRRQSVSEATRNLFKGRA